MSLAQHTVFRMEDSRHIFLDLDVRRLFSRTVARIGEDFELVVWGAADDHAHATTMGDEASANQFARRVEISLTKTLDIGVGFKRCSPASVRDQSHLRSSTRYDIDQPRRHGVDDPFHEGTSLPDMVGARVLAPYLAERVARHVPNARLEDFAPPPGALPPPDRASDWAEATQAAIGRTTLRGNDALALDARRAVLHFAPNASRSDLAAALEISPRSAARLRHRPLPGADLLAAIEVQARWRAHSSAIATASQNALLAGAPGNPIERSRTSSARPSMSQ